MSEINLIGGFYLSKTRPWSAQDVVNWVPVKSLSGGTRSPYKLRGLPGLRQVDPPIIVNDTLTISGDAPDSAASTAYSFAYTITGGLPPYTVSLLSGSLPPGLSLSSSGVISGTTGATLAAYPFTIRAEDAVGNVRTLPDTITIVSAVNPVALSIWNKLVEWYSNETGGASIVGRKNGIAQTYRTQGAGPHSVTLVSSPVGNAIQLSSASRTNCNGYSSGPNIGTSYSYNDPLSIWAILRITAAPSYACTFSLFRLDRPSSGNASQACVIGGAVTTSGDLSTWQGVDFSSSLEPITPAQPALNTWASFYAANVYNGATRKNEAAVNGSAIQAGTSTYGASSSVGTGQLTLSGGMVSNQTLFLDGTPPEVQLSEQAFFNARLTQPEVDYLHNGGTFRTFTQLKSDAGIP